MKASILIFGLVITFLSGQAQIWTQIGENINGENAGDISGCSVDINSEGNIVVVGAMRNAENGEDSGQVRVFENILGTWQQIGNDINGDFSDALFGSSVSINDAGNIIAVGAHGEYNNAFFSGYVNVYKFQNDDWVQIGEKLIGESINDYFGVSVSLDSDGTILAVGADENDGNGINSGHVRVFQNINDKWFQIGEDIDGEAAGDWSGQAVRISSDGLSVVIGSYGSCEAFTGSGQVRVFKNIEGSWIQIGENINGVTDINLFGIDVDINSDGTVIAGSSYGRNIDDSQTGSIRLFQFSDNEWIQIGDTLYGDSDDDCFGSSIKLNATGSILVCGARGNDENGNNSGYIKIFQYIDNEWAQIGEEIFGELAEDGFGGSVCINNDGSIVAAGASGNDENGENSGQVGVFIFPYSGVKKNSDHFFNVYPNPNSGIINIDFGDDKIQKLIISDITGKEIIGKLQMRQIETVNLSKFENGIYIISIHTDNEVFTLKILKR